jgi:hypothetical protein
LTPLPPLRQAEAVRLRSRQATLVLLALLALAAGGLNGFLPHTDDGCPTEIHCLVCRSAHGRVAAVSAPAAPALALTSLGAVAEPPLAACLDSLPDAHDARGPPLFS